MPKQLINQQDSSKIHVKEKDSIYNWSPHKGKFKEKHGHKPNKWSHEGN